MQIVSEINGGILYIRPEGDVDHHSAKFMRENIDELIIRNNPQELELDLSAIDFMDSSGLGLVLGRYKKLVDIGGRFKIINPSKRIFQILQLAGVDKIIKIEHNKKIRREYAVNE